MKILVPTKRVPDTDQKIVASEDGRGVRLDKVPFVVNPCDVVALEEALRILERRSDVHEVVAVGIGAAGYEQQLRLTLAMGASRAIHVRCEERLDPWNIAKLLKAVVNREKPQLVILGKQATDDDANQTGQFLAALLDWPQATFVTRLENCDDEITVGRETDYGTETIALPLPAVVTADLRLNEPRYASLAGIMKARRATVEVLTPDELGVAIELRARVVRYRAVAARGRCQRVNSVDELVELLCLPGAALQNNSGTTQDLQR
ncbi:MAG TPA: electron transfer flavoprotein subunit beta/FixA family protein [Lacipirellulaceae bacterium]|jgi:electron transfer flavoprotein beta subunit|nr:electron transfer flavoprotein subunit beta/FixA family protein [Lacipirellulaceae bacterium]